MNKQALFGVSQNHSKLWRNFPIAMLLLLGLIGSAGSAVKTGDQILGVNVGFGVPFFNSQVSQISVDVGDAGPNLGLFYYYHLKPNWGLGLMADYFISGENVQEEYPIKIQETISKAKVLSAEASVRYLFLTEPEIHPYLVIGAGLAHAQMEAGYASTGSGIRREYSLYKQEVLGPSVSLGAGMDYELTQSWFLGVDVKWRYLAFDKKFSTRSSDSFTYQAEIKPSSLFSLGVNIAYKFGK